MRHVGVPAEVTTTHLGSSWLKTVEDRLRGLNEKLQTETHGIFHKKKQRIGHLVGLACSKGIWNEDISIFWYLTGGDEPAGGSHSNIDSMGRLYIYLHECLIFTVN